MMPWTVEYVVARLQRLANPANVAGMARYGIRPQEALGVPASELRALAKEIGRNHDLALSLWPTALHEARFLAALLADPGRLTPGEADRWARDFDSWALCDSTCLALLCRTPFARTKAREWTAESPEYVRRAGLALFAALAVHDRNASDEQYLRALELVEQSAADDRNFVKKAAVWAIRQIGRRNSGLHAAARASACRLLASSDPPSRWVGRTALRELTRLAARLKKPLH
jgi:3-methyladenine DNA glycosylase AlkD